MPAEIRKGSPRVPTYRPLPLFRPGLLAELLGDIRSGLTLDAPTVSTGSGASGSRRELCEVSIESETRDA
jgi:hypothetical protein